MLALSNNQPIIIIIPPLPKGGRGYTVLPLSVCPSFHLSFRRPRYFSSHFPVCRLCWFLYTFNIHLYMHIFRRIFISNYWWQESDIWSQASYRYAILWEAFLDPSDSYFLFADLVGFYTLNIYAHFSSHFSQQLLMAEIWYLVTSFI